MNAIKAAGAVICGFMIVSGVIGMLVPEGSMEKSMRFVITVAFIAAVITAFSGITSVFPDLITQETLSDTVVYDPSDSINSLSARNIERELTLAAENIGIRGAKINVDTDISDDGSIRIISVEYTSENERDRDKLGNMIKDMTGCESIGVITDE